MQKLFVNGDILTMEDQPCEAVLIEDGVIKRCGSAEQLENEMEPSCEVIDLQGHCLMPSFIDPHSHLSQYAVVLQLVNLQSTASFEDIRHRFEGYLKTHEHKQGTSIIGHGYDHNYLKEQRHPTKEDLDAISKEPLMIAHISGHMGVANSAMLEKMGLHDVVKDPQGGHYGRDAKGHLNGYLEETAFMQANAAMEPASSDALLDQLAYAQKVYASYGITTIQDGFLKEAEFLLLQEAQQRKRLFLDVVAYIDIKENAHVIKQHPAYLHAYQNHLKIGGYKLFLDGSPQGRTAWMSSPYEGEDNHCGYPIYTDQEVQHYIEKAMDEHVQIITHCNGDAAAQQYIDAFHDDPRAKQIRPVMIHAQLLRPDQLPQMKRLHMIPSFFAAHVWYWGDIHIQNFGMRRAEHISCAKHAWKEHMPFTFHQDTPVIAPNMLETIWCAVNRITKNKVQLQEAIPVMEALKAVTIYAAYQYFEEDKKGSIKEGKLADLVILDKNPCRVDPMKIKDIQVLETIKEGRSVYRKAD